MLCPVLVFLVFPSGVSKALPYSSARPFKQLLLQVNTLTGIWDFEPWCCRQDPLTRVRSGVEAVLVDLRWENVGHGKNEAQQPGHQDRHDDLGAKTRQDRTSHRSYSFQLDHMCVLWNGWAHGVRRRRVLLWATRSEQTEMALSKTVCFDEIKMATISSLLDLLHGAFLFFPK